MATEWHPFHEIDCQFIPCGTLCKVERVHMIGLASRLTILWLQDPQYALENHALAITAIGKHHIVGVFGLTRSMK